MKEVVQVFCVLICNLEKQKERQNACVYVLGIQNTCVLTLYFDYGQSATTDDSRGGKEKGGLSALIGCSCSWLTDLSVIQPDIEPARYPGDVSSTPASCS